MNGTDVYVGGFIVNTSTHEWNACYWKNGTCTVLTPGPKSSVVNSLFIDGLDIYASGWQETPSGIKTAALWKNGVISTISEPTSLQAEAYSVFVK